MPSKSKVPRGFYPAYAPSVVRLGTAARHPIPLSAGLRLKALLERPDAASLVRNTPSQELFLLAKQVGLSDALEVLSLARPEQIQEMMDLDVWPGDLPSEEALVTWFECIGEAHQSHPLPVLEALDPELQVWLLTRHCQVIYNEEDLSEHDQSLLEDCLIYETPDGRFLVGLRPDDELGDFVRRFIKFLYDADPDFAHRILEFTRWELPASLEEAALSRKNRRLEALGFVGYDDAQRVYRPLGDTPPFPRRPSAGPLAGPLREVPLALQHTRPSDGLLFSRAMALIWERHPEEDFTRSLLGLANMVMAANRMNTGDLEDLTLALQMARSGLNLGLEIAAGGALEEAVRLIETVHLEWLFRRGMERVQELQHQAAHLTLYLRPVFRKLPGPPVLSPDREMLEGLRERRPRFFSGLLDPAQSGFSPFQTLDQVRVVEERLWRLEVVHRFVFRFLGTGAVECAPLQRAMTAHHQSLSAQGVYLTSLCQQLTGGDFAPDPLEAGQFREVLDLAFEAEAGQRMNRALKPDFVSQVDATVQAFGRGASPAEVQAVSAFVRECLEVFREAYGGLSVESVLDFRFIDGPLYITDRVLTRLPTSGSAQV